MGYDFHLTESGPKLIEINTTDSVGDTTKAAEAMAAQYDELADADEALVHVLKPTKPHRRLLPEGGIVPVRGGIGRRARPEHGQRKQGVSARSENHSPKLNWRPARCTAYTASPSRGNCHRKVTPF